MADTDNDEEFMTVRAFVEKSLQERWLLSLGKRTRRAELLDRLSHHYDWDRSRRNSSCAASSATSPGKSPSSSHANTSR